MDQQEDDVWGGLVPTDHSRPIIKVMFPRTMPRFVIGSTKDKDVDFDISQWDPSLSMWHLSLNSTRRRVLS